MFTVSEKFTFSNYSLKNLIKKITNKHLILTQNIKQTKFTILYYFMTILHQLPELCFRHQNNCDIQNRKTLFVFKLRTSWHATVCTRLVCTDLSDWQGRGGSRTRGEDRDIPKRRQDLWAPSLPSLQRQLLHVSLGSFQELFEWPRGHVLRDKYHLHKHSPRR